MNENEIKQYIKEAHKNSIDKGFYDCPDCNGTGFLIDPMPEMDCPKCKGTGIDPNSNIGEKLMLIVSELGEALEAHRKNKFADKLWTIKLYYELKDWGWCRENSNFVFEELIKDTFEDEIADVFIRLFDLCGYLNESLTEITKMDEIAPIPENVGEFFIQAITILIHGFRNNFFHIMYSFCIKHNIDIEKHIQLKMAYNKTRPRKHGKEY